MLGKALKRKVSLLTDTGRKKRLRHDILSYYSQVPVLQLSSEETEAIDFLKRNRLHVFPYPFVNTYTGSEVNVLEDKALGLKFVIHEGKKLYFKRKWGVRKIKRNYSYLLLEQDLASPHRYLTKEFKVLPGDVVADAGAAEGNFALSIVEIARKIYLFETDPEWVEALEATFAPWKEKVEIINKFVSNRDDAEHQSLDSFFSEKETVNFIKADVEGAEAQLLQGAAHLLSQSSPPHVAITTYHQQQDAEDLSQLLLERGYRIEFSDGFMIFHHDKHLKAPYLRRGLIRASYQSN
ncbi:FkbM family methyltransferase [Pontibacter akesuensis]|uniref:Methyltransferase FkbM domain-containing protein n=1 Tax=Pontibacter akesuensis TaxID=388950 RepID=A0A1I7G6Y2_9BACT|nr:FkbM family methyltransferase [Pontibacter akesuensis]GHA58532.1 hypothetical protein GCM10007389_08070 [Pontibacter akesuensis]SFU44016.1 Methyltransferase FkbM domain-containing protein [Pontibacter akesuensis]